MHELLQQLRAWLDGGVVHACHAVSVAGLGCFEVAQRSRMSVLTLVV